MENVESFYPLSPSQQGMLFHSLDTDRPSEYFRQLSLEIGGDLNAAAFESAWQGVLHRHAVLRTSFVWDSLSQPVQVVHRNATLPWEQYDWTSILPPEQE